MPEIHTDFVRNGGIYMILEKEGGFRSEHLNRVQRSMLAAVSIPNLLRLDIREVDFNVSLLYDITGKRMLSQCLKNNKIGMPEFYGLLLQVVTILDEGKRYMLNPANFLLDEQHIFVEEPLSSGILYFTYVPMKEALISDPLPKLLEALITRLLTSVSNIEGGGIQEILRFCDDEKFTILELKQKLLDLLTDDRPLVQQRGTTAAAKPVMNISGVKQPDLPESSSVVIKEYLPVFSPSKSSFQSGTATTPEANLLDTSVKIEQIVEKSLPPKAPLAVKPAYIILGALLLAALSWKFLYLNGPGRINMYICLVLTVLLPGIGLLFLTGKLSVSGIFPKRYYDSFEGNSREEYQPANVFGSEMNHVFPGYGNHDEPVQAEEKIESFGAAASQPATVLLSGLSFSGSPAFSVDPVFYLERFDTEGRDMERILVQPGSFMIGRSEEIVQYVEKTAGVSRAHAELMVRKEGCYIKDLGSKNGTSFKGELMAPYKEYPIEPGDTFQIAGISFKLSKE